MPCLLGDEDNLQENHGENKMTCREVSHLLTMMKLGDLKMLIMEEILLSPMTKAPIPSDNSKKQSNNTNMPQQTYKIAYTYKARSSEVLRNILLKKWGQSDVDPKEFKRIIRTYSIQSPNFNDITNIKSFDFSTLYTTIPHQKLKSRLATIIRNSFIHKNRNRRYEFLV